MPTKFQVRLKYADKVNVSAATFSIYTASISNIQTYQPFFRDQLLALFQNYVVVGCEAKVRIVNTSGAGNAAELLLLSAPASYISSMTFATAIEYPGVQKQMLSYLGNHSTVTMSKYVNLRKVYNSKIIDDSDFWGTASAGIQASVDQQAIAFCTYPADGSSTVSASFDRELYFDVVFFRLFNPGVSLYSKEKNVVHDKPEVLKKKAKKLLEVTDSD